MAPSALRKLGAAIAFASAGRVAALPPGLVGGVVDAISGPEPTPTHPHTTGYVTATSTSVNGLGETTVAVVVVTTICPVTASTAALQPSGHGVGNSTSSPVQNPASVPMTTSTFFATRSSTVTACPTAAPACTVGDVTTVLVALSTTVCPATAAGGPSNSTGRPTASGHVPGLAGSSTGAQRATTKPAWGLASSSGRPQPTITSLSVVFTTVSASSTTSESEDSSVLEMATGSPSDYSAVYTDATETLAVPTPAVMPTSTNYNGALMSLASSVQASSAEQTASGCQGMDCIVVQSNSGVKSKMNASGFALVALAGAVFLL